MQLVMMPLIVLIMEHVYHLGLDLPVHAAQDGLDLPAIPVH